MISPPIVTWELRRATDKPFFRGLRLIAAISAALTAFLVMKSLSQNGIITHSGRSPFFALLGFTWVLCHTGGLLLTAPALSEEKSSRMLELSLMTHLKGRELAFAKLLGLGIPALQILAAIIPTLACFMALGGVSQQEFWRGIVVLLITLGSSLALGLWMASIFKHAWSAILGSLSIPTIGILTWHRLDQWTISKFGLDGVVTSLFPGPLQALRMTEDTAGLTTLYSFNHAAVFSLILGLSAFCLASLRIARYQSEPKASRKSKPVRAWRSRHSSRDLLKSWLQRRCANPARALLLPTAFGLAAAVSWSAITPSTETNTAIATIAAILLQGLIVRILTIGNAAENFTYARKMGELELALVTPLRSSRIRRQILKIFDREFYIQVGGLIVLNLVYVIYAQAMIQTPRFIYLIWLVAFADTILVAMDGRTAIRCALLQSALHKSTKEIIWRLSATIALVPWLLLAVAVATMNALTMVLVIPIDYLINSGSQWFADLLRYVFGGPISLTPRTEPLFFFAPYFGPLFLVFVRWATGAFWNANLYFGSKRVLNHDFRRLVAEGRTPGAAINIAPARRRPRPHILRSARSRC